MSARRLRLPALAVLLLAGPVLLWTLSNGDEHRAFRGIAYPCLPLDVVTTDPADFVMVSGLRAPPNEHIMPDGTVVYPVFTHPDQQVVPRVGGKVVYFPARFFDPFGVETPPLPPAGRPLPQDQRYALVRYLPDETKAALTDAIEGTK